MATYKIIGKRYLRKYSESAASPVYSANVEAQKIVQELCSIPWKSTDVKDARMTYHTEEKIGDPGKSGLDLNVDIRDEFDAALFCADHKAGQHRAFANAAVYRYSLPDSAVGVSLTSLALNVTSDPYNSRGARIHVFTNSSGEIPMSCHAVRGEDDSGEVIEDGTTLAAFAPRTAQTVSGTEYWYPTTATGTITPTDGLTLGKYLFVTVVMESYSTVRGNWIEGCSFIENLVTIETSTAITGWTDGSTQDLRGSSRNTVSEYTTYNHDQYSSYIIQKNNIFNVAGKIDNCIGLLKPTGGNRGSGWYRTIFANGQFSNGSSEDLPGWIVWDCVNNRKVVFASGFFSSYMADIRSSGAISHFLGLCSCELNNEEKNSHLYLAFGAGAGIIHVTFKYNYTTGSTSSVAYGVWKEQSVGYFNCARMTPIENNRIAISGYTFCGAVFSIDEYYHMIVFSNSHTGSSSTTIEDDGVSFALRSDGYINYASVLAIESETESTRVVRIFVSGEFKSLNGYAVNHAAIISCHQRFNAPNWQSTGNIEIIDAGFPSIRFDSVIGLRVILCYGSTNSQSKLFAATGEFQTVNGSDLGKCVTVGVTASNYQVYPISSVINGGRIIPNGGDWGSSSLYNPRGSMAIKTLVIDG